METLISNFCTFSSRVLDGIIWRTYGGGSSSNLMEYPSFIMESTHLSDVIFS